MPRKNPYKSSGINEVPTHLKEDKKIAEKAVKEDPKKIDVKSTEDAPVKNLQYDAVAQALAELRGEIDEPESGI